MKSLQLNITYIKILSTVDELNEKGYYPLSEGIYKIISGAKDNESLTFKDISTYGTLISFNSKKVCRFVLMLTRYGYLDKVFDRNTNELYLRITDLGKSSLISYKKQHKVHFKQKEVVDKITIVKLK